jgi:formiminotetrahydrofolate cyclodeaminase
MTLCLQALEIAPEIARIGNVNCVSDAGTGAELLLAGLEGAAANVLINLPSLQPEEGIPFRNRVAETRRRGRAVLDEVRRIVGEKLVG